MYGIAAVTRAADARFNASTSTSTSIRLSFGGEQIDCSTNTSLPRTFSSTSTMTSPSENRPTLALPKWMFRCCTTSAASFGVALPVNTIKRSYGTVGFLIKALARKNGWGGRDRTYECRNQNPVPYHLATPQRLKPAVRNPRQHLLAHLPQWVKRQTLRHHAPHRRRQSLQHFPRRGFAFELRKYASA